jgi:hypothetical protein
MLLFCILKNTAFYRKNGPKICSCSVFLRIQHSAEKMDPKYALQRGEGAIFKTPSRINNVLI